tara:strand:+ start:299 stop:673 length:375 start_codon:yes stop_codon:yes gene_type:complete
MKLLLAVSLLVVLTQTQGCIPSDVSKDFEAAMLKVVELRVKLETSLREFYTGEYDTQYKLPERTFEGILLAVPIHFKVRCDELPDTVVVVDTYGQVTMISGLISSQEIPELNARLKEHALEVCN